MKKMYHVNSNQKRTEVAISKKKKLKKVLLEVKKDILYGQNYLVFSLTTKWPYKLLVHEFS